MEKEYIKLDKKAKCCMRLSAAILWAIILIPTAVILLLVRPVPLGVTIGFFALVAIGLFNILIIPSIRYERYRYSVGDDAVMVRRGFLWIHEEIVPIERLHKLELRQGPIARIYKFSTVCVTTAGGDVNIKFLKETEAENISMLLKSKINEIVREERK